MEFSCCSRLRPPDVSIQTQSVEQALLLFKQGHLDLYFPNVREHVDKASDLSLLRQRQELSEPLKGSASLPFPFTQ